MAMRSALRCAAAVAASAAAPRSLVSSGASCMRSSSNLLPLAAVPVRTFAAPATAGQLSGTAKAKLEKEKRKAKKKAKTLAIKVRPGPTFHPDEALRLVKASATAAFDETVEVQIQLGIDPRKPAQNIRGVAPLPFGTGKAVNIAVFARGEKAEDARRAGATLVGAEDLVDRIAKGEVPLTFTKTIATPDVMPLVGKIARILGPRGLMPNPKLGTVTPNVREAVAAAKRGQAEFRAEKRGLVMAGIGRASFEGGALRENLRSFLLALGDAKPEGLKGSYIRGGFLKSTMGPGIPLDPSRLDPTSPTFLDTQAAAAAVPAAAGAALDVSVA